MATVEKCSDLPPDDIQLKSESEGASSVPTNKSKKPSLCEQLRMVSPAVYIAVMLFAMSTWIAIVSVWVEMPLLVNALPESWSLPSYLVIIIQCANLGPAAYAIYDKLRPKDIGKKSVQRTSSIDVEIAMSLGLYFIAVFSMLLMSAFWGTVTMIGGSSHSTALLVLVCFAALASCTSSVVFLPYMARFPSVYISAYYFGQGLCGLIPGVAGLIQGAGHEPNCLNATDTDILNGTYVSMTSNISDLQQRLVVQYHEPRFSVSAFFVFVCILLCVSCIAFVCLSYAPVCKKAKIAAPPVRPIHSAEQSVEQSSGISTTDCKSGPDKESAEAISLLDERHDKASEGTKVLVQSEATRQTHVEHSRLLSLLAIVALVSALWNGVLPATQSYTCLPYGSIVYTLSICLSWIMSPLATLPNMISPTSSLPLVGGMTFGAAILSAFHLVLAGQSPHPILQHSIVGQIIVVVTAVIIAFSFSFIRVSVASILRREGGRRELLWCGGITQLGSFCGAIVSFLLVSVFKVFERLPPCST